MTPTHLIQTIQLIEGVVTVEPIHVNPSEDNEILVLITFNPEPDGLPTGD
jgi:hypothetical protein